MKNNNGGVLKRGIGLGKRKIKNTEIEHLERYLILCFGKVDKINYFNYFKDEIQKKHNIANIDIYEKEKLVDFDLIEYAKKRINRSPLIYEHIWIVIDKEEFSEEVFERIIRRANAEGFRVAWTSESFDWWYFLHTKDFNDELLTCAGQYQNGFVPISQIKKENIERAVINAQRFDEALGKRVLQGNIPKTNVQILVKELLRYI